MSISEEVLMGIAAVSVTLIGFSGVVTALGRKRGESWSQSEAIQLFALVAPSIVTLVSAFVPVGLQLITEDSDIIWRASNGVCFLGGLAQIKRAIQLSPNVRFGVVNSLSILHLQRPPLYTQRFGVAFTG